MSIKTLLEKVEDRAKKLTADLRYQREGFGEVPLDYHLNILPSREMEEMVPFCWIFPGPGSLGRQRERQVVAMFCYREEDRATALTHLDDLVSALHLLAHPGGWSPWVQKSFSDSFGDGEHNQQPHPLYVYKIVLGFMHNETLQYTPWRD